MTGPTHAALRTRLIHAVEGECDGLALDEARAEAILQHVLGGQQPAAAQQGEAVERAIPQGWGVDDLLSKPTQPAAAPQPVAQGMNAELLEALRLAESILDPVNHQSHCECDPSVGYQCAVCGKPSPELTAIRAAIARAEAAVVAGEPVPPGDMRASFEDWMSDSGKWPNAVERTVGGGYALLQASSAWSAWKAAWAAATQPAAAPQPVAQGDVPPVLVRDLAEIIGVGVPSVCAALLEIGRPPRSTNMAIGGEEAVAVAKRLAAAPAGVAGEPVAWSPDLTYPGYSQTRVWANGAPHQKDIDYWRKEGYGITLAYTAPPARQALTQSEVDTIVREATRGSAIRRDGSTSHRIARAIERACAEAWGVTLVGIGGKGGADHG